MSRGTGTGNDFGNVTTFRMDYGLAALAVNKFVVKHAGVSGFAKV